MIDKVENPEYDHLRGLWINAIPQLENPCGRCQTTVISSNFCPSARLCLGSQPGSQGTLLSFLSLSIHLCLSMYCSLLASISFMSQACHWLPSLTFPCAVLDGKRGDPCQAPFPRFLSSSVSQHETMTGDGEWGEKMGKDRTSFFCVWASESVPSSSCLCLLCVSCCPRRTHAVLSLCQVTEPLGSAHTPSTLVLPAEGWGQFNAAPVFYIAPLFSGWLLSPSSPSNQYPATPQLFVSLAGP